MFIDADRLLRFHSAAVDRSRLGPDPQRFRFPATSRRQGVGWA
jgi:hypothetical protein